MNKSIMFISDGYNSPYPGNYIPSLMALETALKQDGFNVIYVMDNRAKSRNWCLEMLESGSCIKFFDFGKRFATLLNLIQLIKKEKINIVHKHFGSDIFPLLLSLLFPKVKFFSHIHSDWSMGNEAAYQKNFKQRLKEKFGHKITKLAVSKKLADTENGIFVPNRLVLSRRKFLSNDEKNKLRDEFGIPRDKKLLLVLGWSPNVKGIDFAVNAVKQLREEGNDFLLAIVRGEGIEVVTDFIAEKCGMEIPEYIYILPPQQDVFLYYGMADIMLCPSRSEGFSYALVENISVGNPAIASDILGHSWAKEFEGVTFFESQSTEQLKKAILNVNNSIGEEGYTKKLKNDVEKIEQSYGIEDWITRLIKIYNT